MTSLAAAATGAVVSAGVLLGDPVLPAAAGDLSAAAKPGAGASAASGAAPVVTDDQLADRAAQTVSRSDRRAETDPVKAAALSASDSPAIAHTEDLSDGDPRIIAQALLPEYGFSADQFPCLDSLYNSESGWRIDADNPSSSAYGIPQALTALHDLPADYMTSAEAQIRWGLEYIQRAYGTPCGAWSFKQGHGWY